MTATDVGKEIPDYRATTGLRKLGPEKSPNPSSFHARRLAEIADTGIRDLELVLEALVEAVRRGLNDSAGASSSGGEPVGGSKDFTESMLRRIDLPDDPAADQDDARKHLSQLVDALQAAKSWASNARYHAFALKAISPKQARVMLGEEPASCVCCGRTVLGGPADRIRTGRCSACWQVKNRTGEDCSQELHDRRIDRETKRRIRVDPREAT